MSGGLQTALALSIVALAAIYLGWKAWGLIRAFFGRKNKAQRVELVRFPPRGEKRDS